MKKEFFCSLVFFCLIFSSNGFSAVLYLSPTIAINYEYFPSEEAAINGCESFMATHGNPGTCYGTRRAGFLPSQLDGIWYLYVGEIIECADRDKVPNQQTSLCECQCGMTENNSGNCEWAFQDAWQFVNNHIEYNVSGDFSNHCPSIFDELLMCKNQDPLSQNLQCAFGQNFHREVLYQGSGPSPLAITLHYRSHNSDWKASGHWRLFDFPELKYIEPTKSIAISFPEGDRYLFPDRRHLESATATWSVRSAQPMMGQLHYSEGSWQYELNDKTYFFNTRGQLIRETNHQGQSIYYLYLNDRLQTISNDFRQSINIHYDNDNMITVIDPAEREYQIHYDTNGLISTVIFPDTTADDLSDNPIKQFIYGLSAADINAENLRAENDYRNLLSYWQADPSTATLRDFITDQTSLAQSGIAFESDLEAGINYIALDGRTAHDITTNTNVATNDYAIAFWLRKTEIGAYTQSIISKEGEFILLIDRRIPWLVNLQTGERINASANISYQQWHLLQLTKKDGILSVYLDGENIITAHSVSTVINSTVTSVPLIDDYSAHPFKGQLAELKLYDEGLGPEIYGLYQGSDQSSLLQTVIDEDSRNQFLWQYDEHGSIRSQEGAGGLDKKLFVPISDNTWNITNISDANQQLTYLAETSSLFGNHRITRFETIECSGCERYTEVRQYNPDTGLLETSVDARGHSKVYQWDQERGLLTNVTIDSVLPALEREIIWHSTFQLPIEIRDPEIITQYEYDELAQLTQVIIEDRLSQETLTWQLTYNGQAQIASIDGPRNDIDDAYYWAYDDSGNVTQITMPESQNIEIMRHSLSGKALEIRDSNSITTLFSYNERDQLNAVSQLDRHLEIEHYPSGRVKTFNYNNGLWLDYTYGNNGLVSSINDQNGDQIELSYNAQGLAITQAIRNNNQQTLFFENANYNLLGQLLAFNKNSQALSFEYNDLGLLTVINGVDANDTTEFAYNQNHQLQQITQPNNLAKHIDYLDEYSVEIIDEEDRINTFSRNAFNQLVSISMPDISNVDFSYDAAGNRIHKANALNQTIGYEYDGLNRLSKVNLEDDSLDIDFIYGQDGNAQGLLEQVVMPDNVITYQYDTQKNKVQIDTSISNRNYRQDYSYDDIGNVSTMTYPSGKVLRYHYDTNNNITSIDLDDETLLSNIQHLPFGPPETMSFANGFEIDKTFNQDYTISRIEDSAGFTQNYYYSQHGLSRTFDEFSQQETLYEYDYSNRLISQLINENLSVFNYDGIGKRVEPTADLSSHWHFNETEGTEAENSVAADLSGTIYEQVILGLPAPDGSAFGFTTNARSIITLPVNNNLIPQTFSVRIVFRTDNPGGSNRWLMYQAHGFNIGFRSGVLGIYNFVSKSWQLTGTAINDNEWHELIVTGTQNVTNGTEVYLDGELVLTTTLNNLNNSNVMSIGGNTLSFNWNFQGEIDDIKIYDGLINTNQTIEEDNYDLVGNVIRRDSDSFSYNALGQMQSASVLGGNYNYAYDGLGRRISKTNDNMQRVYIYNAKNQLIAEADTNGALITEYVYLNDDLVAFVRDNNHYFVHSNWLGAPIAISNSSGAIVWQAIYDAFGQAEVTLDLLGDFPFRLPGHYFDEESDLHYNGQRYYDPVTNRYLSPIAISDANDINLYAYANNDPLNTLQVNGVNLSQLDENNIFTVPSWLKQLKHSLPKLHLPLKADCFDFSFNRLSQLAVNDWLPINAYLTANRLPAWKINIADMNSLNTYACEFAQF